MFFFQMTNVGQLRSGDMSRILKLIRFIVCVPGTGACVPLGTHVLYYKQTASKSSRSTEIWSHQGNQTSFSGVD